MEIEESNWVPTREEFYTNYPSYKYWSSIDNEKLLTPEGINIYIHIPFCIQICDYCFYMKELVKSKDQVDIYVDALCQEIKLISEKFGLQKRKVNSIYIGGGTPSILTEAQFKKLMGALHKHHDMDNDMEFAFEAEPGTFTKTKLQWYKEGGVNRISMGVQSFNDDIIKLSGRKHTSKQAKKSIETVKEVGGFELNIDLLSGLAGEKMTTWKESVDIALNQKIDMLTIYKMKAYANTVFFRDGVYGNQIKLPDSKQEVEFMRIALDMLQSAGFEMWSTFAFTKNGSESRYIENTWRNHDMIAYGASSFGKIGNINYQNINNIKLYETKIENGTMPIYRTFSLSVKDEIVKELLLCSVRLASYKKKEFEKKFGFDYFNLIPKTILNLQREGYITGNIEELELTQKGIIFSDFVSRSIANSVKQTFSQDKIKFEY
ncbi:radical SAM family heme chaperone HemW [Flagellimonas marinaquae]|nr:radical SAM family heme chaperone HemW [Allomuricauda sp.]MAU14243.1 hypothetical protein [Allomuricauda sp.]MBC73879.1 hypothetical protein [Allomuricauda sp.]UBZ13184.1 radical SAM family heme chaperone HemW [Allomuricauda aquimarina]|tara:strand:+ start:6447 stop:7745 length:1299 start_codon:yes stop_codon:yes gene_type:complete